MNERIRTLAEQAGMNKMNQRSDGFFVVNEKVFEKFAELIKQAIYDIVKEELIADDIIAEETPQFQEYLKGCNGGTVDALCHIKNFGVDRNERTNSRTC